MDVHDHTGEVNPCYDGGFHSTPASVVGCLSDWCCVSFPAWCGSPLVAAALLSARATACFSFSVGRVVFDAVGVVGKEWTWRLDEKKPSAWCANVLSHITVCIAAVCFFCRAPLLFVVAVLLFVLFLSFAFSTFSAAFAACNATMVLIFAVVAGTLAVFAYFGPHPVL